METQADKWVPRRVAATNFWEMPGGQWENMNGVEYGVWARVVTWRDEYDALVSDGSRQQCSGRGFATLADAKAWAETTAQTVLDRRLEKGLSKSLHDLTYTAPTP